MYFFLRNVSHFTDIFFNALIINFFSRQIKSRYLLTKLIKYFKNSSSILQITIKEILINIFLLLIFYYNLRHIFCFSWWWLLLCLLYCRYNDIIILIFQHPAESSGCLRNPMLSCTRITPSLHKQLTFFFLHFFYIFFMILIHVFTEVFMKNILEKKTNKQYTNNHVEKNL